MSNLKIKKSKILLIILCLLALVFSYSCSCRNEATKPPVDNDAGTFLVESDLKSSIFRVGDDNKKYGSSDINITLDPHGKEYTAKIISIEDITDGKTDKLQLAEEDFSYAKNTGLVTIKESGLNKIGALTSTDKPDDRKVKITLEVKATDTTLQNNPTNVMEEVHLIKVQKFTDATFSANIQKFKSVNISKPDNDNDSATFKFTSFNSGVMQVKQEEDSSALPISKTKIKANIISRLNNSEQGIQSAKEVTSDTIVGGGSRTESIKFKVQLEFGDDYDGSAILNPFTVEVSLINEDGASWES